MNKNNSDMVNHPKHYTNGKIECIEALEAATVNKNGIEAVCVANIIKYLWRYESKNGLEDVKKSKWYLEHLIKYLEEQANKKNKNNNTLDETLLSLSNKIVKYEYVKK